MKRFSIFILILCLLLAGCGKPAPAQESPASETPESTLVPSEAPTAPSETVSLPAQTASLPDSMLKEDDSPDEEKPDFEAAKTFVDKTLEELTAVIGEPLSSSYVSSCLGPGQDGELVYDGFTVYTYREGSAETILDVIES
ncbi:MAG: hypothetical protein K6C08_14785 [Oscillospiraceae bacterium]|nr:hypothetical protein [Oscillospiraceae bacterium]